MTATGATLELKRRALQAKNAGDLDEARRLLTEAKNMQQQQQQAPSAASSSPKSATDFKKLAVQLKRKGDIGGAKEALTKARQLEREQQAIISQPIVAQEDPVNKAIDEANLEELTGGSKDIGFTDEDMLDVDTMADMASSGMDIPSEETYKARALACKKAALQAKNQGDITSAKQHLMKSRQLEAVTEKLFRSMNGDDSGAAMMEDDGEDYSLLDELMNPTAGSQGDGDGFMEDFFGTSSNAVELDDLDDLDPSMLQTMMDLGMSIPNVNEILHSAKEKKALAIACKKDGNLVAAKAALEESKRLEGKATQLSKLLRAIETGACEDQNLDPDAMFEAALKASEEPAAKPQAAAKKTIVKEPLKSSHEYKVDAVRLKQENKMSEAVAALRKYKEALVAETSAADAEKRKECIDALQAESKVAKEQVRLFKFYEHFVDGDIGGKQMAFWKQYEKSCTTAINGVKGEQAISTLSRSSDNGAIKIDADDLSFIGEACDAADTRIEVTLLEAIDINDNKHMKKILENPKKSNDMIRIVTTVQVPPSADTPDDNVEFTCNTEVNEQGTYSFDDASYHVEAVRGSSRFAKLVARRLQRKRVTFDVYYVEITKGFLSQSSKETLLGTAVVELKHLLSARFVAGDFPLLDGTRRHETGGLLRISVRTGAPFGAEGDGDTPMTATTGLSLTGVKIRPYPAYRGL